MTKTSRTNMDRRAPNGKGTDRASQAQDARAKQARLAEALRENLKKRKAQSRGRKAADEE